MTYGEYLDRVWNTISAVVAPVGLGLLVLMSLGPLLFVAWAVRELIREWPWPPEWPMVVFSVLFFAAIGLSGLFFSVTAFLYYLGS